MNILLTSVGRRDYMVDYFKEAVRPFGGQVHATSSHDLSSGLWSADAQAISPLIYDDAYPGFMLNYCLEHRIDMLISLFDIELPVLASLKERFAGHGIRVVVADEHIARLANDKWATQEFLRTNGFLTVPSFLSREELFSAIDSGVCAWPVYIKPRWGMGSIGVYRAEERAEAEVFMDRALRDVGRSYLRFESETDMPRSVMAQAALPGQEYGLDIINDLDGNYRTTIVKRKLAMRSGETDAAMTVDEPVLVALGERLSSLCRHPGNMDVDVFFDGETPYILEINPRFGGGYPFSHLAGVDLPSALVRWHLGEPVDTDRYLSARTGIIGAKGVTIRQQPAS